MDLLLSLIVSDGVTISKGVTEGGPDGTVDGQGGG